MIIHFVLCINYVSQATAAAYGLTMKVGSVKATELWYCHQPGLVVAVAACWPGTPIIVCWLLTLDVRMGQFTF